MAEAAYDWETLPMPNVKGAEERDPLRSFLDGAASWSEFAASLSAYWDAHGKLTDKQRAAAERMKAKCDARAQQTATDGDYDAGPGLDLTGMPSGMYAVPGGDTRLKVQIDVVQSGRWEGWVFVKDGAQYGDGKRYGSQKPGATYRGQIEDELRQIAANPFEASKAYGKLVGRCGVCNRPLEDETSVANGIGPICAKKFG